MSPGFIPFSALLASLLLALQAPSALHFEFYEEQAAGAGGEGEAAGEDAQAAGGLRVMQIPAGPAAGSSSDWELLCQLVRANRVPEKHRFALLQKVRPGRAEGTCRTVGKGRRRAWVDREPWLRQWLGATSASMPCSALLAANCKAGD